MSNFAISDFDVRLRIWNKRSAMGSAEDLLPCLCWPSLPTSPCVSLTWNWKETFWNGKLSAFAQIQKQWGYKSICKNIDKNRAWIPTDGLEVNPCLPATTPRRRQSLCCLGFEMTLSGQQWGVRGPGLPAWEPCWNKLCWHMSYTQTHMQARYRWKKRVVFG